MRTPNSLERGGFAFAPLTFKQRDIGQVEARMGTFEALLNGEQQGK
ncbi:MAG TPA: hypothetical protein PKA47_17760 [Accumulibacter sp.]|nr:hypothetical protein [Accumulibacter sp.]HMW57436.1 hypothetical protein [Accumulibacter sp.]HNE34625.1 hypothetical protein [Nitrospira sp.]